MTAKTIPITKTPAIKPKNELSTWRFIWQLIRYKPWLYISIILLRAIIFAGALQATALLIRGFFDTLTEARPFLILGQQFSVWVLAALFVGVALFRAGVNFVDVSADIYYRFTIGMLMRKNIFSRILDRTGDQLLPSTTGDAINRLSGDVEGVVGFILRFPHLIGMGLLCIFAVIMMISINVTITLLTFFPLVVIVLVANVAMRRVEVYRDELRQASGQVSGFIGELFGMVQAIKVASAEERMLAHFQKLNDKRRKTAVQDGLFGAILNSVFENIVNLSTGLILIFAGYAIQAGSGQIETFTVGDLALFVFYLGIVTGFISQLGELSAEYKRAEVNKKRVEDLLQDDSTAHIVQHGQTHLRGALPPIPFVKKDAQHRLETLKIKNLSYTHPRTHQGINKISFSLKRGTLTIITGRIGSGKSTLIRTLLGHLPKDSGEILWNDQPVINSKTFFTYPYCAYTPQVPVLFSGSVRDNILMGLPEDEVDLPSAVRLAVMEKDVDTLEAGLDTVIGVKGVRLSGGQAHRTAAARMFVRSAELLLFDDLSSALDVETERKLWNRLATQKEITYLAVSHRRSILQMADNIILLKDGRIESMGSLEALLKSSEEMNHLWQSELAHEIDELLPENK
ncbi:MAG: ABC transporter ATP-binding protein [Chloroflexota bacterium]